MYHKKFTRPPLSSCKRKGPHADPPQTKQKTQQEQIKTPQNTQKKPPKKPRCFKSLNVLLLDRTFYRRNSQKY